MLKWVFGADTRPCRQGLSEMRSDVKAFSGGIKGMLAGAFTGGAIIAGAKTILDHFGRIQDLPSWISAGITAFAHAVMVAQAA